MPRASVKSKIDEFSRQGEKLACAVAALVMGAGPFEWKMEKNAGSTKTLLLHPLEPAAAGETNIHFEWIFSTFFELWVSHIFHI